MRSGRRLKAEHERSDRLLAEERELSRAQIEEERRIAREREQLAEAYAVQVVLGAIVVADALTGLSGEIDDTVIHLAVLVVNHGKFTITGIDARFSYDGMSLVPGGGRTRVSSFRSIPEDLLSTLIASPATRDFAKYEQADEPAMSRILTPWDVGMRFESDRVALKFLRGSYPLVRWTDRWGTQWENRRGEVRQLADDEPWVP